MFLWLQCHRVYNQHRATTPSCQHGTHVVAPSSQAGARDGTVSSATPTSRPCPFPNFKVCAILVSCDFSRILQAPSDTTGHTFCPNKTSTRSLLQASLCETLGRDSASTWTAGASYGRNLIPIRYSFDFDNTTFYQTKSTTIQIKECCVYVLYEDACGSVWKRCALGSCASQWGCAATGANMGVTSSASARCLKLRPSRPRMRARAPPRAASDPPTARAQLQRPASRRRRHSVTTTRVSDGNTFRRRSQDQLHRNKRTFEE